MALLAWEVAVAVFVLIAFGLVAIALHQRREVKVGLKIPFVAFFFEAKDHEKKPATRHD